MSGQKITIIGGGGPFIPALIVAMTENKDILSDSEVCLMDINSERLPTLNEMGKILAKRKNAKLNFTWTTDPWEALRDATFVMFSYRIGGVKHMRDDIKIPTKYGIPGDETTGPGGTFMAQRTIPATLNYCKKIEDLCPEAWVQSYINPAGIVANAVHKKSNVKYISMCDCFAGLSMDLLPKILDMPPFERRYCVNEDIKPREIGVNHLHLLVSLEVNGKDGYPLFKEKLNEYQGKSPHDQRLKFSLELMDILGYFCGCSEHTRPYWDNYKFLEERKESISMEEKILGWSETRWNFVKEIIDGVKYEEHPPEYCFGLSHARQAVGVMVSIIADEGREWGGLHFPNRGAIKNLPDDAIVEGPAIVDKTGITPLNMGNLPKSVLGITKHVINWEELSAEAAITGDIKILNQAVLECPYVHDVATAKKIMKDLLEAHANYLPQFKEKK